MVQSIHSDEMTQAQIELVEHALRIVTKISTPDWRDIPTHLQPLFARYMDREVWLGGPDLLSLSQAALMILRDAIARSGEFSANTI